MGRLEGRVAAITGGASGIGLATAERYAEEGARLVLADRNEDALAEAAKRFGDGCTTLAGDVRDEAHQQALADLAVSHFGQLDIGVNCAGIGTVAPIDEHPIESWNDVLGICLTGVFLSIKHQSRVMKQAGRGGVIVNIASINARVPGHGMAAYCSAKAGVEMLTRVAAMELAPEGIRVAGIGPGFVDTPLTGFAKAIPGIREAYLETIPLGRAGAPRDVANAALFLASDDASWVTGDTLFVDGAELTKSYPEILRLASQGAPQT